MASSSYHLGAIAVFLTLRFRGRRWKRKARASSFARDQKLLPMRIAPRGISRAASISTPGVSSMAKKTELAGSFSVGEGVYAALLAGAEFRRFFDWLPPNFRVRDQGIFSRIDATRTYLAGRSGVAINCLLMNHWDYVFWDHVPTLYARALRRANISHAESVRRASIIASRYSSGI